MSKVFLRQPSNPRAGRLTSMDRHRPGVTTFVHIGLVVKDLDETAGFLTLLGFDCEPGVFSGEWIDRIIGPRAGLNGQEHPPAPAIRLCLRSMQR